MVQTAFELALQFGVQLAQLKVCSPQLGELIKIGEHFHDCEDGDLKKGVEYFVHLVASPGLQKIGDGAYRWTSQECFRMLEPLNDDMDRCDKRSVLKMIIGFYFKLYVLREVQFRDSLN